MKRSTYLLLTFLLITCMSFGQNNGNGKGKGKANGNGNGNGNGNAPAGVTTTNTGKDSGKVGENNSFFGYQSGTVTTANNNSFFGANSGLSNTIGIQNVYLGSEAGRNAVGSGNVFIGNQAGFSELGNNKLYIGNSDTSSPLIFGDFTAKKLSFNGDVHVGSNSSDLNTRINTYGNRLFFQGNHLNNQPISLIKYNRELDDSELRMVFSDQAKGSFSIGSVDFSLGNSLSSYSTKFKVDLLATQGGIVGIGTDEPKKTLEVQQAPFAGTGRIPGIRITSASRTPKKSGEILGDISFYNLNFDDTLNSGVVSTISSRSVDEAGNYALDFGTGNVSGGETPLDTRMTIDYNGNIGIGTTTPEQKLTVKGGSAFIEEAIYTNGRIAIGTTAEDPGYALTVKGKVHVQEVKVDLMGAIAPDYVFLKDYKLKTLDQVQEYINKEGHLPNIPSATQMEEEGINLKEMNLKLLEKIEELTLYTIAQEKAIKEQKESNQTLEERLAKIEKLLKQ